ncbi:hypothetical protein AHF37_04457 [Paragonimus kellicotti]|nr:hypothetical protein AHF37_04457 [Paragonimus kellicotti]
MCVCAYAVFPSGLPVPGETDLSNLTNDGGVPNKDKSKVDPSFCADVITSFRLYTPSPSYVQYAVVNLGFVATETVWKAFWCTEEVGDSQLKQSLSQELFPSGLPVPGETDLSNLTNDGGVPNKDKSKVDRPFVPDVITSFRLYTPSPSYVQYAVVNLGFVATETVWKAFWCTEEVGDSQLKQSLSQERLFTLVSDSAVLQFVLPVRPLSLAEVLIPNVLRPIPHPLTQAIRNFAKSSESWMRQAT